MTADGDEGAVRVDEGDDGTDEGVVDVGEIRGEELFARARGISELREGEKGEGENVRALKP